MKKLLVVLALSVFAATVPVSAEIIGKGQLSSSLLTCKASRNQRVALVDNGQPATPYIAVCRDTNGSGAWNWVNVGGLSVLLAGDTDGQDIYGFSGNVANAHFTLGENTLAGIALTSVLFTTPKFGVSGVYEHKVTNVTTADDAAGTKPAIVIPITSDSVTCTCNDATGCAATIAEPTPTATYSRFLYITSVGTGNCEFADVAGVTETGGAVVLEPTSVIAFTYVNSAWHMMFAQDNVQE